MLLRGTLLVLTLGAVFFGVLPQLADLSEVWSEIAAMSVMQLTWLCAVAIGSLLAYGLVLMAAMPGLSFAQATVVSQSSTAVANTVPAGGALAVGVSFRFYESWGFSRAAITRNVIVTGIWNIFGKLGLPVVALALLALSGGVGSGVLAAAVVGVALLLVAVVVGYVIFSSEPGARRVGVICGRVVSRMSCWIRSPRSPDGGDIAVRFRHDTIGLLRNRGWRLTGAMLVSQLSVFLVLLWSLRAVGITASEAGWVELLAVFAVTRLASAVPLTPGGIGFVELGLAGALLALGCPNAEVVAGVLAVPRAELLPAASARARVVRGVEEGTSLAELAGGRVAGGAPGDALLRRAGAKSAGPVGLSSNRPPAVHEPVPDRFEGRTSRRFNDRSARSRRGRVAACAASTPAG